MQVYKIVSGQYDSVITPTIIKSELGVTTYDFRSLMLSMICVSSTLLIRLLTTGIVCPIGL